MEVKGEKAWKSLEAVAFSEGDIACVRSWVGNKIIDNDDVEGKQDDDHEDDKKDSQHLLRVPSVSLLVVYSYVLKEVII